MKGLIISLILFLTIGVNSLAQSRIFYEVLAAPSHQKHILSFLADDISSGRPSGTPEQQISCNYIISEFKRAGLKPFNWSYTQSFHYDDTLVLHNIMGVVPAICPSDEYVIVSAHYDHIGTLNNVVYNGADDNASGVTALISLAQMFSKMRSDGVGPKKHILFVAFDGKELSMAGSEYFVTTYPFEKEKIVCNINMDILGGTVAPIIKSRPDYMIVLGEHTLDSKYQGLIKQCNDETVNKLHLDFTFYGSKDFTTMMYELGDHYAFAKKGIPALLFTSGFHEFTYKPTDDIDIIDFPILSRRTILIYNFIRKLTQ